jgi:hypothetical protein
VDNIKMITSKSQALQDPASQLNLVNGALVVVGQGPLPQVIFGFADIVTTAGKAFVQMQGMEPVSPGDASDAIFDSFREFVKVHQALLNILIGKAGLFTTIPFIGAPVAAVLRQIEKVVDTLANTLIDTLQGRGPEVQEQGDMLMGTVEKSIQSFQGLQLSGDQSMGSDSSMMMSGGSDPLSQTVESITGSLKGPLSGLLGGIAGPALSGSSSSSSMMPMSTGGSMMSSSNSTSGGMMGSSSSIMGSSSSSMSSSMPSTSTSMPSSAGSPMNSMSSGSPSGISLSSGDDTLKSILGPLSGLLSGGGASGSSAMGGSTSMPAKRAIAFQA